MTKNEYLEGLWSRIQALPRGLPRRDRLRRVFFAICYGMSFHKARELL